MASICLIPPGCCGTERQSDDTRSSLCSPEVILAITSLLNDLDLEQTTLDTIIALAEYCEYRHLPPVSPR